MALKLTGKFSWLLEMSEKRDTFDSFHANFNENRSYSIECVKIVFISSVKTRKSSSQNRPNCLKYGTIENYFQQNFLKFITYLKSIKKI